MRGWIVGLIIGVIAGFVVGAYGLNQGGSVQVVDNGSGADEATTTGGPVKLKMASAFGS